VSIKQIDIKSVLRKEEVEEQNEKLLKCECASSAAVGVTRALLMMGTPANREMMDQGNILDDAARGAGPNDLIFAAEVNDAEVAGLAEELVKKYLKAEKDSGSRSGNAEESAHGAIELKTVQEATKKHSDLNLAMISVPGAYAATEALFCLKKGLDVFIFSDNVSLEDEKMLKGIALQKGLLVMGPDCGTAILDGVSLGFANSVSRGPIGLVGASGTGLQEVSSLIDQLGQGITQVIGTGGRDLTPAPLCPPILRIE